MLSLDGSPLDTDPAPAGGDVKMAATREGFLQGGVAIMLQWKETGGAEVGSPAQAQVERRTSMARSTTPE
jgi:hypothetical protein